MQNPYIFQGGRGGSYHSHCIIDTHPWKKIKVFFKRQGKNNFQEVSRTCLTASLALELPCGQDGGKEVVEGLGEVLHHLGPGLEAGSLPMLSLDLVESLLPMEDLDLRQSLLPMLSLDLVEFFLILGLDLRQGLLPMLSLDLVEFFLILGLDLMQC